MTAQAARHAPLDNPAPPRAAATVQRLPDERPQTVMHPDVYRLALLCWVGFMAVFWFTFWMSANALFVVVVGSFYAVMFFGVPYMMIRQAPRPPAARSLRVFLRGRFDTIYGPVSGLDALLQVLLVPLLLGMGGIAIGIIIHSARG